MMYRGLAGSLLALGFLTACQTAPTDDGVQSGSDAAVAAGADWQAGLAESAARFRTDLSTLASDEYEGRESGTPGYEKAVEYVVARYEEIGLAPAGEQGYLQDVKLRRATAVPDAMSLTIGDASLTPFNDFVVPASVTQDNIDLDAEVVFVGYGIDAPMFGLDPYADVDVRGKIVAVVNGAPDGLPSEESAHFGQGSTKSEIARQKGAVGMVLVSPTPSRFDARLREAVRRPQENVVLPDDGTPRLQGGAYLTRSGTEKLAHAAGVDIDELTGDSASRDLGVRLRMTGQTEWEDFTAPNVIGMIEGSDPALKDEYVVLTAHLDHIGKLRTVEDNPDQDIINNGAMDNASGIATLLEEARKFQNDGERPRRSILFVALAAEEKGLLGSEYFVADPTVPRDQIVANVNLDMPILKHDFTDVIAFGAQHSSLEGVARTAAASMDVTLSPDPVPDMVLFVRSDHYNFVKAGIPSVFLFLGFDNGGQAEFRGFMSNNYHRPSDDLDQEILWETGAKFAEINYRIAKAIANADERPTWNEGDFFGEYFGRKPGM